MAPSALKLALAFMITIVIVASIPLVPVITATVQVSTSPNHHPTILLLSIVYQRVSIFTSFSEPMNKIQLTPNAPPKSSSHYYLSEIIQYQNQLVTQGGSDLSDGSYVVKASFWPISENSNTPYVVTITVSQDGYYYATVEAKLTPT